MGLTTNFGFTTLESNDTAGHTSINTCLQSIDNALNNKTNVEGMIMVFDTSVGDAPDGWTNLGTTISGSGLPTLSSTYVYIKKTG